MGILPRAKHRQEKTENLQWFLCRIRRRHAGCERQERAGYDAASEAPLQGCIPCTSKIFAGDPAARDLATDDVDLGS